MFIAFNQLRNHIGEPFHFDFRYTLLIPNLEHGWRGSRARAGGGCLLDMGYHVVDLLTWYFGVPSHVEATLQRAGRPSQHYDVEDTCNLRLAYKRNGSELIGNVFLSRVFPHKEERLTLVGSEGMVVLDRHELKRVDAQGNIQERLIREGEWPSAYLDQLTTFADWTASRTVQPSMAYQHHLANVAIIEAGYRSAEAGTALAPKDLLTAAFKSSAPEASP
jgi:predicted dehydrogenase